MLHAARARKADMEGSTTACHSCGYKKCQCAGIDKYYAENPRVTPPVPRRKTHSPSTNSKHVAGVTACGKFYDVGRHKVQLAKNGDVPTCAKCQAIKITQPETETLWGIEMTPARKAAIEVRDREKVKRQSARWAKQRSTQERIVKKQNLEQIIKAREASLWALVESGRASWEMVDASHTVGETITHQLREIKKLKTRLLNEQSKLAVQ
jgi:hypothetical protein